MNNDLKILLLGLLAGIFLKPAYRFVAKTISDLYTNWAASLIQRQVQGGLFRMWVLGVRWQQYPSTLEYTLSDALQVLHENLSNNDKRFSAAFDDIDKLFHRMGELEKCTRALENNKQKSEANHGSSDDRKN